MYDTLKLDKAMYNIASKSFTQALSELDPDENYKGTDLEGLDAYERQLKRFDIKVSGNDADTVDKFFKTTESAVLFPEFIRRCIKNGMEQASILSDISAVRTSTSASDFRRLSVCDNSDENDSVSETEEITGITITLDSTATSLEKIAKKLSISYEAIRTKSIELFAVALRKLGSKIAEILNMKAAELLYTKGTASTAEIGTLTYNDLLSFVEEFSDGKLTTLIVSPEMMSEIMKLSEMQGTSTDASVPGRIKTPFGVEIIRCNRFDTKAIIGIDKSSALEFITGSDVIVETDKLISTQMEDTVVSIVCGFAAIDDKSIKFLSVGE